MDKMDTMDHLQHQQWLLKHGFVNDLHKDNLHSYGSLIHKDVGAVYTRIDHTTRRVDYTIYCENNLLNKISKYNKLRNKTSMLGLWSFKRFLNKEGNLNFDFIINKFVQDYCGKDWNASLNLKSMDHYRDDLDHEKEEQENIDSAGGDKPTDR